MKLSQVALPPQAARQAQRRQAPSCVSGRCRQLEQPVVERAQRCVGLLGGPPREMDRGVRLAPLEFPFVEEAQAGRQERRHGGGAVDVGRETRRRRAARRGFPGSAGERSRKAGAAGEVLAHRARRAGAQAIVEALVVGEVEPLLLQRPLEVPVGLGDEQELRVALLMRAIASGQNGASTGGVPSRGRARSPQVRAMTSGSSSIAMSQRTPSARSAIRPSSAIIDSRRPPCR